MDTIETFGLPSVVPMRSGGTDFALIQTESVEGEYIALMVPSAAARKLATQLEQALMDME